MATFGYFVKDQEPDIGQDFELNLGTQTFRDFLTSAGLGYYNSSSSPKWSSNDYFKRYVLGLPTNSTVTVTVKTRVPNSSIENDPALLTDTDISTADFIIINQTVPSALQRGLAQKTFRDNDFSPDQVLKIFKKIAGVEGTTPIPYMIDFTVMGRSAFTDVRSSNEIFTNMSNPTNGTWGYVRADQMHILEAGQGAVSSFGTDTGEYLGTDANSYKLYKLLSSIDPATLYGLYFKETDGSYGIDRNLNLIGNGPDNKSGSAGEATMYNLNSKIAAWGDKFFRPNYLTTSSRDIDDIMSTMGWKEFVKTTSEDAAGLITTKQVNEFCEPVGNSNGIVYNSATGLFSAIKSKKYMNGTSEADVPGSNVLVYSNEDRIELTEFKRNGSNLMLNWDAKLRDGESIQNCRISFVLKGTPFTLELGTLNKGGGNREIAISWPSGTTAEDITAARSTAEFLKPGAPVGTDKLKNMLAANITEVKTGSTAASDITKLTLENHNDYHPYRILIVSDNTTDSKANRSVVADIVREANSSGVGLAGGVVVDCISKYAFDNISVDLNETYDIICITVNNSNNLGSIGKNKYDNVFTGTKIAVNSGDNNFVTSMTTAFNTLRTTTFGVDFINVPTEYYVDFNALFQSENGWGSYQGTGSTHVAGNKNYINDDSHSTKRTLDFDFKVYGASTYDIELYVDVDGDCRFESTEKVTPNSGTNANNNHSSTSLDAFFGAGAGESYVGGFAWKIVVTSGTQSVSKVGYSAVRNEDGKNKIKILQIVPTDYHLKYGASDSEMLPHPMLILPTDDEIKEAKNGFDYTNTSGATVHQEGRGEIGNYKANVLTSSGAVKGIDKLKDYFDGVIKLDVAGSLDPDGKAGTISSLQRVWNAGSTTVTNEDGTQKTVWDKRSKIIHNSSLLYYYLDKLEDYEIEVTRYSVYQFNIEADAGRLKHNSTTHRIGLGDGNQEKNIDGSLRYDYSPAQLGLTGNTWKTETVNWTEGSVPKYLVTPGTNRIYGIRGVWDNINNKWVFSDGSVTYFSDNESDKGISGVGQAVQTTNTDNEFDLVMIGFGGTLDYMSDKGVELLRDYLTDDGPAFIGNGAISTAAFNTFGKDPVIRNKIGISTSKNSGYDFTTNTVIPMMEVNDTLFSHFPYRVSKVMKGTGDTKQPYTLTLTGGNDPVVAFAKYCSNNDDYNKWGDAQSNYFLFKQDNIVFCGFGPMFNDGGMGQVSGVMPMAETLMIVNALVAASRFGSGGTTTDPYFDCTDDDSSTLDVTGLEDDYTETNTAGDDVWFFKDAIYTDYDAYAIANYNKTATKDSVTNKYPVFNTPMKNSGTTAPKSDGGENVRWIPYEATLPTADGGFIEFKTPAGDYLDLKVYSNKTGNWVTPTDHRYKVDRNGTYIIGIPLNTGAYPKDSGLGFSLVKDEPDSSIDQFAVKLNLYASDNTKVLERHTIMMIRRVLFHAK